MDRFADRRFDEILNGQASGFPAANPLENRNDLLSSPFFNLVSPPIIRWAADRRGRLIGHRLNGSAFDWRFESEPAGYGWLSVFDLENRKLILRAATQSTRPDPFYVRIRSAGAWRWALLRMACIGTAGEARWYGTIEDVQDRHDNEERGLKAALEESREHYRASVDLNAQVPWTADPTGSIEEAGPRWWDLTGMTVSETLGAGWMQVLHPDDVDLVMGIWTERLQSGDPVDVDYRIRLRDGNYRWMRARAAARRNDEGAIIRWYGTLEDIHERKVAQDALSESEARFRLAAQAAQLGIWDYDFQTRERTWSPELRAMLGVPADQPATAEIALAIVHPDDRHILADMMTSVAMQKMPARFEATLRILRMDDGVLRWIRSVGWNSLSEPGRTGRMIVAFQDVTDQHDAEDRIRWAAAHDAMTGMPNRALWQKTLEDMTEQAGDTDEHFGLLLFDIDDLKRTNDLMGHDAGDALLREFARRLTESAPSDAVLGRLGGDEFGLIAGSLADSAALQACSDRLLECVRQPFMYNGRSLNCGVSIGGAVFGEHGEIAQDLLKAADLALYASKASGRGRLTLFHSELRAHAQQQSSMLHMAREAVAKNLIVPYYQPKVDLRSGRTVGYEALLRWNHPRLGVQLPGTIAAAFDTCEIAVAMTACMLDAVVGDVRMWIDAGFDPGRIAINTSASDFMQDDFAERVLSQLERTGVSPANFEIEVTETVFLGRGAQNVERALHLFAKAGVRIALDDFGTGYASLSHLKQYPVDVLKIDRSFISNLGQDAGDAAIVEAIVKLGGSMGIEIVAEGVETQRQITLLREHGCHIGQGFYLGYPQPAVAIRPAMFGN